MNGSDFLSPLAPRIFEGEFSDAARGVIRDYLEAFDDAGHDLMFEAGIEVFGILADDYQINILITSLDALERFDWPEVRVQVKRLAQSHVRARKAFADGRHHRPFQGDL